jgi:hypothetical protein
MSPCSGSEHKLGSQCVACTRKTGHFQGRVHSYMLSWISYNKNQLDALIPQIYFGMKLYMFQTVPLSIIRNFSLYTQQWYTSYRFVDSCLQNCMTYTIAVCTVRNSWWWTEELSEICRVSFQNKFEKLVHLVGFIIRTRHDARSRERKFQKFMPTDCIYVFCVDLRTNIDYFPMQH